MAKKDSSRKKGRLGRGDWIAVARQALIDGGIEKVKVDRLARTLGVTRGGFYWHFKDREDLLRALLKSWEETNTNPLFEAVAAADGDPRRAFRNVVMTYVDEKVFSPAYDAAVRDWARTSVATARAVRRVDNKRIGLFQEIFLGLDYVDEEAFIRARITYYHQVGYYALNITESRSKRLKLFPLYAKALTGVEFDPE